MKEIFDKTLIFTKPWEPVTPEVESEVILTLERKLLTRETYFTVTHEPYRLDNPTEEFWREFYSGASGWMGFEDMIRDFKNLERNPLIVFYSGPNITRTVKEILGPTKYIENIGRGTIREMFGNAQWPEWRDVAHAPKPEEYLENLRVLRKYHLVA